MRPRLVPSMTIHQVSPYLGIGLARMHSHMRGRGLKHEMPRVQHTTRWAARLPGEVRARPHLRLDCPAD